MTRLVLLVLASVAIFIGVYSIGLVRDWYGLPRGPGEIVGGPRSAVLVSAREAEQRAILAGLDQKASANGKDDKQILFGDLHVHTTNSTDAFLWSLPIFGGEGTHPLADACDYARHCSAIDFWAITDHAEATTPKRWEDTKQSVRACNALSTSTDNPDMVSFVGFEWTQVGARPEEHYGHKNVIFKDLEDNKISARAIGAGGMTVDALRTNGKNLVPLALPLLDFSNRQDYFDMRSFLDEAARVPLCSADVPADQLPKSCFELAYTPGELVNSLEQQGLDPLIIPHGTTWGFYTPTATSFDKHLKAENRPEMFPLFEIMSGHGSSEEYRSWRSVIWDEESQKGTCPAPTADYLPMCWRAGEIIRERCLAAGEDSLECNQRATDARDYAANASSAAHLTVPGTQIEEWLDAGQCRDCFQPSFGYRPANSAQYALAIQNFDDLENPTRLNMGFIASSDNHRARPGTGYKAVTRLKTTESVNLSKTWRERLYPSVEKTAAAKPIVESEVMEMGLGSLEMERQASYWTTGGLAAVHSQGRSRDEIYAAMQRRETYGTSGARMLLWFNTKQGAPMGSTVQATTSPEFEVTAVGAHKQKPGCPEDAVAALGEDRIQKLCANECFNPSNERLKISRIEIVRIRPQVYEGEDVSQLIDNMWKVHTCRDEGNGCSFSFTDPEFADSQRAATYYARAIQEPTLRINGDTLGCTYDDDGNCVKLNMCFGDDRTSASDDCKSEVEERAWSSPIYVEHGAN
jgi:hypothetical protein